MRDLRPEGFTALQTVSGLLVQGDEHTGVLEVQTRQNWGNGKGRKEAGDHEGSKGHKQAARYSGALRPTASRIVKDMVRHEPASARTP